MKNGKNRNDFRRFYHKPCRNLLIQCIRALDEVRQIPVGDMVVLHFASFHRHFPVPPDGPSNGKVFKSDSYTKCSGRFYPEHFV